MSGAIGVSHATVTVLLASVITAAETAIGDSKREIAAVGGNPHGVPSWVYDLGEDQQAALDSAHTILGLVEASENEFARLARLVENAEPDVAALHLELAAKQGGPAAPLLRAMARRLSPAALAKGHGRAG